MAWLNFGSVQYVCAWQYTLCIYIIYMLSFFRSHCGSRFLLTFICFVVWALSAQDVTQVTLQTLSVHCHIRGGGYVADSRREFATGPPPHYAGRHMKGGGLFFPHTWSNPHEKKYCHIKGGGCGEIPAGFVILMWQGGRWAKLENNHIGTINTNCKSVTFVCLVLHV